MKRFIEGEDRYQSTLFPEVVDDYVGEDNHVRVIEAFIDELELGRLGFSGVEPQSTGRPSYHPSVMLKIYVYGYLNRIQSSRRLEKETQRNVELMWLTGRLTPDFKTIADFRRDHGDGIRAVCREFIALCRQLNLFSEAVVAIDGSKFKAVNSRRKNYTRGNVKRRMKQIEASLDRYFVQLERADRDETPHGEVNAQGIKEKIDALKAKMREVKALEAEVLAAPDQQISLTDPDARSMVTSKQGSGVLGYNVQAAVDADHHLIVDHEVTNVGSDRNQLSRMGTKAKRAMDRDTLTVVADRGYFKNQELLACHETRITPYVPRTDSSSATAAGRYGKEDFIYDPKKNEYRCPAGDTLTWRTTGEEDGMQIHRYWSSNCQNCHLKDRCTPSNERRVRRWEHEALVEAAQRRLEQNPGMMLIRKQTVEHPFGTIKSWMGSTHFQMKTLKRVSTEMSLHVLAYNMKRVMQIVGIKPLIEAIQTGQPA